jgi:hypothetical protein
MVGGVLYYVMLFVMTLSIGIYNFSVYSTGSATTCYSPLVVPSGATAAPSSNSTNSTSSATTANTTTTTTTTTVSIVMKDGTTGEQTTNIFKILNIVIAICYLIIAGLSLLLILIINNMANMVPDDFLKIGSCKRFLACFTKIFPPLFILIHYVIMVAILAVWVLYLTGSCNYAVPTGSTYYDETKYYKTIYVVNLVSSIFWLFLQYVGAIIRDIVYQEPFMYSPTVGKPTFSGIVLKKLGP